jgi:hypothetical protein
VLGKNDRPTYNGTSQFAFIKDLANSIVYEGKFDFYTEIDPQSMPVPPIPDPFPYNGDVPPKTHPIPPKATCLFIDKSKEYAEAYWYTYDRDVVGDETKWTVKTKVEPPTHERTFQFHIDWLREVDDVHKDIYYHEAEVLWNPELEVSRRVSIINLPLEDYYTKEQTDYLIGVVQDLSTRQADWLATARIASDQNSNGVDNPAYIRNKPLTGMSVLDGGVFPRPENPYPYPQYVVDGGDFNILGTWRGKFPTENDLLPSMPDGATWAVNDYAYVEQDVSGTGAAARYKIREISGTDLLWERDIVVTDLQNLRQEVIVKVWTGNRADLPPATVNTAFTLKWCKDTNEIFIDQYGQTDDGSFVRGNKRLNIPDETFVAGTSRLTGTETASWDATKHRSIIDRIVHVIKGVRTEEDWKLLSTDSRLFFEQNGKDTSMTMRLNDIVNMFSPGTMARAETTFAPISDNDTALLKWTQYTYNGIDQATPTATQHGFGLQAGWGMAIGAIVTASDMLVTLGFDAATTTALDGNPIVSRAVISNMTDGAKLSLISNKIRAPVSAEETTKSLAILPGLGIILSPGGTADEATTEIDLHGDVFVSLNTPVLLDASSTIDNTGATLSVWQNKTYKKNPVDDVHTGLTLKPDDGLIIEDKTDPATPRMKIAQLSLDPRVFEALNTQVVLGANIAGTVLTLTTNELYNPDPTPTAVGFGIGAGNGMAVSAATVGDTTTVSLRLDDGLYNDIQRDFVKTVTPDATNGLALTFGSDKVHNSGTPVPTNRTVSIVPGDGIIMTNQGTPTEPVIRIETGTTAVHAYATAEFTDTNTPAKVYGTITYTKYANWVHAQVTMGMVQVDQAQQGTFPQLVPEGYRPLISVRFGEISSKNIEIKPDGSVSYFFNEMGWVASSIMYFVDQ